MTTTKTRVSCVLSPSVATVFLILSLLLVDNLHAQLSPEGVFPPTCNDCFCQPDNDEIEGDCPLAQMPRVDFDFANHLKQMAWKNPITLDCNPFQENADCQIHDANTKTPINNDEYGQDAICAVKFQDQDTDETQCYQSYTTRTFSNRQELEQDTEGFEITHNGACGVCSSMQDLVVYMDNDGIAKHSQACGVLLNSLAGEAAGIECFQFQAGYTLGCATAWAYFISQNRQTCIEPCLASRNLPPNVFDESTQTCPFNACYECTETTSGDIFYKVAGRNQRRSGLLNDVIYNCSDVALDVTPISPCPISNDNMESTSSEDNGDDHETSNSAPAYDPYPVLFMMTIVAVFHP